MSGEAVAFRSQAQVNRRSIGTLEGIRTRGLWGKLCATLRFALENVHLLMIMIRERPDIVHCNDFDSFVASAGAASVLRRPIVTHVRNIPYKQDAARFALKYGSGAIAVSAAVKAALSDMLEPRDVGLLDRVTVIHNPFEPPGDFVESRDAARAVLGINDNNLPIVGYVGAIEPVKGQLWFLEHVAPELVRERVAVAFAGATVDSSYEFACRTAARGLGSSVRFLGYVPRVERLLRAFDAVALASEREGLARIALEAGSAAIPMVMTDVGGAREIVEDGRSGYLVPPGDAQAMRERLLGILRDPRLARELGLAAADTVQSRFSPLRISGLLNEFYYSMTTRRAA
jgi:glycosyltransferase involved in cell wall biosynthesis